MSNGPGVSPLYDVDDHRTACRADKGLFSIQITSPLIRYGGDRRDRTDDLKLAKLALSQLSYVPDLIAVAHVTHLWWAWEDLNFRPHAYQARALTN